MIDTRELRLNNLVFDSKKVVCSVTQLCNDENETKIEAWPINGSPMVYPDFSFIPLTEEWLLEFGFEFKPEGDEVYEQIWKYSNFEIWQHDKGFCHNYHLGGDIQYVHQLQNLYFALTREELTFNK